MNARLLQQLRQGDRRSLAKAITLVESTRPEHREQALSLLDALAQTPSHSLRLGISGPPGAGKSTLIDALGCMLIAQGHRVAVLAVDPSSQRSGGSILGDKTRMQKLAADPRAFIRPSPSATHLGGVTRRTREALRLCEFSGFDVVIVETVGVGQSETAVAEMVDFFALVLSPGGGDELQGIKRGVVEICDALWVNKADAMPEAAARSQQEYQNALHLYAPRNDGWNVPVMQISALKGQGLDKAWKSVQDYRALLGPERLQAARRGQEIQWLHSEIRAALWQQVTENSAYQIHLQRIERSLTRAEISPGRAAQQFIKSLQRGFDQES